MNSTTFAETEPGGMPPAERHYEILNGFTVVGVTFNPQEGSTTRLPERVKVRKLSLRDIPAMGQALGNEAKEIAAVTGQSDEWVAQLDDESFEALIEEGRRLNFTRCANWLKRQMQLLEAMGQNKSVSAALEKATSAIAEKLGNQFTVSPSPKSASS